MGGSSPSIGFGNTGPETPQQQQAGQALVDAMFGISPPAASTPSPTAAPPPAPAPTPQQLPVMGGMNPGEFALGGNGYGLFGGGTSFQRNPQALSQAGVASTPFGFGTPNPYSNYFMTGPAGGSAAPGTANANAMAQLMGQTQLTPQVPQSVPIPPVNIPPTVFSGGS